MNLTFGSYVKLCEGLNELGLLYSKSTPNKVIFEDESVMTLTEIGEAIKKNNANLVNSNSGDIYLSKSKEKRFSITKKRKGDKTLTKKGQNMAERINKVCTPDIFRLT